MIPELIAAVAAAVTGWVFGRVDHWSNEVRKNDQNAAIVLARLTATVDHLDGTLGRLDGSIERLWTLTQDHERRISHLEGSSREPTP